jgi:hypothetical protein
VLHDLVVRATEEEESFYYHVGRYLTALNKNEFTEHTQIFLSRNKLSRLPKSLKAPQIRSLLMEKNKYLTKISKRVIGSMISLRILYLSLMSLNSFSNSFGC